MDKHAEIRAALDAGPTPGPWIKDRFHPNILDSRPGSSQVLVCRVAISTFNDEGRKNETFIAAANPETIGALLAERDEFLDRLEGAANYIDKLGGDSKPIRAALAKEQGDQT